MPRREEKWERDLQDVKTASKFPQNGVQGVNRSSGLGGENLAIQCLFMCKLGIAGKETLGLEVV